MSIWRFLKKSMTAKAVITKKYYTKCILLKNFAAMWEKLFSKNYSWLSSNSYQIFPVFMHNHRHRIEFFKYSKLKIQSNEKCETFSINNEKNVFFQKVSCN